jgi:hypothetical protein
LEEWLDDNAADGSARNDLSASEPGEAILGGDRESIDRNAAGAARGGGHEEEHADGRCQQKWDANDSDYPQFVNRGVPPRKPQETRHEHRTANTEHEEADSNEAEKPAIARRELQCKPVARLDELYGLR